jgi:phospholipase C
LKSALFLLSLLLSGHAAAAQRINQIQHIVFIVKENRSFDNYFGTFEPPPWGATSALLSTGQVIPMNHMPDAIPADVAHGWGQLVADLDYGKMDHFDVQPSCLQNGILMCASQFTAADIPNYFLYAKNFVLGDNMFSSSNGSSWPNHLYTIAASSAGMIGFMITDLKGGKGCATPTGMVGVAMDVFGNTTYQSPCIDIVTLGDLLTAADISWKSYAPHNDVFNAYLSINHIYNSAQWNEHFSYYTNFEADALSGNLPAVSWLVADNDDEHPPKSACAGENWTVRQINALMQGPNWNNTAIFITWDDPGGFYDHVKPENKDQFGLGMRLPLLIISPFSIAGKISHTQYEFSSVLKFIEARFGLPSMTDRDANANDMTDAFDFAQQPLPPLVLTTRGCPVIQSSQAFQPQRVGDPSPAYQLTYSNSNSTTASDSVVSVVSSGDFSQTNNCPRSLSPGWYCTISVTFTPTASGQRTGALTINDVLAGVHSTHTTNLSGIGTLVGLGPSSETLPFGAVPIGRTASQAAVLTNYGSTPLTISNIAASGDFTQTNNCGSSVPANSNCTITITFSPRAVGNRFGKVTVHDSDPSSPQKLTLTGVGETVSAAPVALNFSDQPLGTSSDPQIVTITNQGGGTVLLSGTSCPGNVSCGVSIAGIYDFGDFSQTNNCGISLAPHGSCTVQVTFTPRNYYGTTYQGGGHSSINSPVLLVSFAAADSPLVVNLTGTVVASTNNPTPQIAQPLSPVSVAPGSPAFTLNIHGAGFRSSSVVNWNGSPLPTQFRGPTYLSASIPAANVYKPGTGLVTVSTPVPGGGISNVVPFSVTRPEPKVSFAVSSTGTGTNPSGIVSADFNGDNIMDIAVTNQGSKSISILLGKGDGTFTLGAPLNTGNQSGDVVVADFNGDGKLDLAAADVADSRIIVFLGNGDGTFTPASENDCTLWSECENTTDPVAIAVGDFNGDGYPDLAVVNGSIKSVSILFGEGDGAFRSETNDMTLSDPVALAIGDFNNDGKLDLAIANAATNSISILLGNGDGTFKTAAPISTADPVAIAVADFNGDNHADLAVVNQSTSAISVFFGTGNGTFTADGIFPTGSGPNSVLLGDFNGDGVLDLATSNPSSNTISILLGVGAGVFRSHVDTPTSGAPAAMTTADFNGDGKLDLGVTNSTGNSVSIFQQ